MADNFLGSLFGQTPDYGKFAVKNERKRQQLINLGLQQINAVYGGGTAPFYQAPDEGSKFDPHQSYYNLTSKGFKPYWVPGGTQPQAQINSTLPGSAISTGGGDLLAAGAVKALGLGDIVNKWFGGEKSPKDIARGAFNKGQLFLAPQYQQFEGFQPSFFQKRAEDYVNYALPQEADQYRQSRNAMLYGQANRGITNSSVAQQQSSQLERTAGQAKQTIADEALRQANQLRQDVESARQANISQLYQTADPSRGTAAAIDSAAGFRTPVPFAPLANTFANLANQYYINQAINNYRQPVGYGLDQPLNLGYGLGPTTTQ